ncbi:MAG: response regulator [Campylobacterota bacterium]|nr:response regulator [Campylobacterota bacterium]
MKILIVDDSKETRESLLNIIKIKIDATYEIECAEDGLEALGIVESFKPDIVLTDILMPKMDGIKFASLLKSQNETKHIFIAAITGLSGEEQIKRIYSSGVDFYISKPFQLDDIVARLKVITSLMKQTDGVSSLKASSVFNCFHEEYIKHYYTTFTITQENDIFLIFDYFSKQNIEYNSIILKDLIVTLIKSYRKMQTEHKKFDLIIEESEEYIYLTLKDDAFVTTIEQLVDKHSALFEYKRDANVISFRINIISFIEPKQDVISDKPNKYQNELISATELMTISSDDLDIYVDELQDALLDYRSLCNEEAVYNISLRLTLVTLFDNYTSIFKKVPEFDRVSLALQSVALLIKNSKNKKFSKEVNSELIKQIEELNITIEQWIKKVIVKQNSSDVHSSDYKIISCCTALENIFDT